LALPYQRFIVDGEIVVHDDAGLPSFQRLQKRARLRRAPDIRRAATELPATFYLFDLLAACGRDVRPLPLVERKRLLRRIVPASGLLRYSDHVAEHGVALYGQAETLGLEGIIAKRADAPYRAGRSAAWQKVRAHRTDEFVVVGWKPASDNADAIGSLHLAFHDDDGLRYGGSVGTGFDGKVLRELKSRLEPHIVKRTTASGAPRSRDAVWVEPVLIVEVRYLEQTAEGQLRHPVFVRIRDDLDASDALKSVHTSDSPDESGPMGESDAMDDSDSMVESDSMDAPEVHSASLTDSTSSTSSTRSTRKKRDSTCTM
ncbi:MAG: hypothetical protein ACREKM_01450, partial [Longimicrobiales bacterium]